MFKVYQSQLHFRSEHHITFRENDEKGNIIGWLSDEQYGYKLVLHHHEVIGVDEI